MPPEYEVRLRKKVKKGWRDVCIRDPQGAAEAL